MKIVYKGKAIEAEVLDNGRIVSKEGNILLGLSTDKLMKGCSVYEEPVEEKEGYEEQESDYCD